MGADLVVGVWRGRTKVSKRRVDAAVKHLGGLQQTGRAILRSARAAARGGAPLLAEEAARRLVVALVPRAVAVAWGEDQQCCMSDLELAELLAELKPRRYVRWLLEVWAGKGCGACAFPDSARRGWSFVVVGGTTYGDEPAAEYRLMLDAKALGVLEVLGITRA